MTNEIFPSPRLAMMQRESMQRLSSLHAQFLRQRQAGLRELQRLLALQIRPSGQPAAAGQPAPLVYHEARPALFDSRQLDEFGAGQISRCLGPAFARYDSRRIPRIPNGDLKMMSRIVAITGTAGRFDGPAEVIAEYDVPVDAWYFRESASSQIPYALWMEIALQPCGFLSAYLDTYALLPDGLFNFRNLDGFANMPAEMDVRGKTLVTRARMLNSVASGGTVIQRYAFEVSCQGKNLYTGESTFGYFSEETMNNQVGLDGGRTVLPWLSAEGTGRPVQRADLRPFQRAGAQGRFHLVDDVMVVRDGGQFGKGYAYARRRVNPADWFYPYHFYQDPVMPGSLGVEAVLETMRAFALSANLTSGLRSPKFELPIQSPAHVWRYRGQITPRHSVMELDVHIRSIDRQSSRVVLTGDASVWVDGLRIYALENAAVAIQEG